MATIKFHEIMEENLKEMRCPVSQKKSNRVICNQLWTFYEKINETKNDFLESEYFLKRLCTTTLNGYYTFSQLIF